MVKNKVLVLNGPNLNMLGSRQPHIYGTTTLAQIQQQCQQLCNSLNLELEFKQSNSESCLVQWLQQASVEEENLLGVVINAAAYTHTSVAIADALKLLSVRTIEVHISNTFSRESFRHNSYLTPAVTGCILGLGSTGYTLAIRALYDLQSGS